jgi:hypothetical protein
VTEAARVRGFGEPLTAPPAYTESVPFHRDLSPLRRLVRTRAQAAGLAPHRVVDLVLAVGEATANTVRHAGGAGTLRVWQDDAEIVCEVSDPGRMEDPGIGQLRPPAGTSRPATGSSCTPPRPGPWSGCTCAGTPDPIVDTAEPRPRPS